ncbi:MAG: hypothetical protein HY689_14605, partial [Chloroflexi bacterium]|nr:hypothetical protein [Chloroflexota bacterium]
MTTATTRSTFDRAELDALKRTYPLAALLVEAGVRLRRTAEGRLIGRCPFHPDGSPSLMVDERDQHFHCFGCGAHGDVITYVMRRDGVRFAEACSRLGAAPPPVQARVPQRPPIPTRRWDRLTIDEQEVMNMVALFYRDALWREPRLLAYLHQRGLPDRTIRSCGLGYADGQSLETYLRARYGERIAERLGLLRKAAPGYGDVPLK